MMEHKYLAILVNFFKKYKKEILWWIFFTIFCQTIDLDQFAYKPENYKSDESDKHEEKNDE